MEGENKQERNMEGENEEHRNVAEDNENADAENPRHPLVSIEHIMIHEIFERCSAYSRDAIRGTCRLWRLYSDEFLEESAWYKNMMNTRAETARDIIFFNAVSLYARLFIDWADFLDGFPLLFGEDMFPKSDEGTSKKNKRKCTNSDEGTSNKKKRKCTDSDEGTSKKNKRKETDLDDEGTN